MKKTKSAKNYKISKKGFSMISESDKLLFWFFIIFIIALCVIFMVAWTTQLKKIYLDDSLQPTAYEARLLYSDKCFAYKDANTSRVYTGVIDPQKFNQNTFFDCMPLDSRAQHAVSAKLEAVNLQPPFVVDSQNWDMKTDKVIAHSYVVEIEGYGPGTITFYHKTGK